MYEIATRKEPYSEHELSRSVFVAQFEDAIINGLRPTIPSDCPPQFAELIEQSWQDIPDLRPTTETIYQNLCKIAGRSIGMYNI